LVEVLGRVPTGRLVVLGEPGAGKTMLMVRLVLDLLARRSVGGPVPILASIASWNPAEQDLRRWLIAQLMIDHPALAAPPPVGMDESTRAGALLASGLILPVLDGLDEIPDGVRALAISQVNDALYPGEPLVITCRNQQYREAIRPASGPGVTLRGAGAVELQPLDVTAVREYLYDDAAGPVAKARWKPVFSVLGTEAPVSQALTTPLMVGLARAIYNPRPGESARTLPDPGELCSPALADRAAVESLLFDAFIPAAYRHGSASCWEVHDAERWLVFVACYLERTIGTPDLAWWQLPLAMPRFVGAVGSMILVGVVAVLGTGLAAFAGSGGAAPAVAVAGALAVALATLPAALGYKRTPLPLRGINWRLPYRIDIALGAAAGISVGALAGAGVLPGVRAGIGAAIGTGALAMAVILIYAWSNLQKGAPLEVGSAASPQTVLARDRGAAILVGGARWAGPALLTGAVIVARMGVVTAVVTVVAVWAIFTVWVSLLRAPWLSYEIVRIWLALRHRLPWRLMSFLADAHRRGVLRQAGAVYQFQHIELQHRLATRPLSPSA